MPLARSAILALLVAANAAAAQSSLAEHWILTMRAAGDSVARPLRVQWKGDSLFAELTANGELIVGTVVRGTLSAEHRVDTRVATRLSGTRDTPGTMSGNWDGRGLQPGARAGTWSAVRTVAAPADPTTNINAERWVFTRIPTPEQLAGGFEPQSFHVDVSWRGDSLVGMLPSGTAPIVGAARGASVEILWPYRDRSILRLRGARANRDSMSGAWLSVGAPLQSGTWAATRVGGGRAPRAISYAPAVWYTTYSSAHAPGLRVAPRDTIRVAAPDPNTSTRGIVPAPIYVEGAIPGDVLAVHIIRIRPSPATAWSQRALELDWFTSEFGRTLRPPAASVWNWALDTLARVARLDTACAPCRGPAITRLSNVTVPLSPMIGNIGVAPRDKQALASPDEGDYGGNLDYKSIGEGATIYLPVSHRGALLSIANDMHAAQGDGELAGTGLEMQADVDFTVDVIRGAGTTKVRAEDASYRMAFGTSADLAQALRIANTNLGEWLAKDFSLNQQELAFLLGSALELDIANVWGAQTTIVAKIKKSVLAQIKP